jgi:MFS family permease
MFSEIFNFLEWALLRLPAQLVVRPLTRSRKMFDGISPNSWNLIWTSVFWMIPVAFAGVYLQVYMREQGLSVIQIGTLGSIAVVFQLIGAVAGGWAADRIGWKRCLIWLDMLLWPTTYLCYATAHGYLGFLIGTSLMAFQAIVVPAWIGMLTAGTPPSRRAYLFALSAVPGMLGGILIPLAGPLVELWGVSGTSRLIYGIGAVTMASGIILRSRILQNVGPSRLRAKIHPRIIREIVITNWEAIKVILRRKGLRSYFLVQICNRSAFITGSTYLFLYLSDPNGAAISKPMLSVLGMCSAGAMLVSSLLLVPFITLEGIYGFMFLSIGLRAGFVALILAAPPGALGVIAGAMVLEGVGAGLMYPSMSSFYTNMLSDSERPRVFAATVLLLMLITIPIPTIAGALYAGTPSAAMMMWLGFYALSFILLVGMMFRMPSKEEN